MTTRWIASACMRLAVSSGAADRGICGRAIRRNAGRTGGNVGQFFNQCIGVAVVFYDAVASLIILSVSRCLPACA
jgi:hypothetical protein